MALTLTLGTPAFRDFEQVRRHLQQREYHLYAVDIPGADGVAVEFQSPIKVRLDPTWAPQAILYQGTGIVLYDPTDPPAADRWTLRRDQRTVVMGTAPAADAPFLFLEVWGVL